MQHTLAGIKNNDWISVLVKVCRAVMVRWLIITGSSTNLSDGLSDRVLD